MSTFIKKCTPVNKKMSVKRCQQQGEKDVIATSLFIGNEIKKIKRTPLSKKRSVNICDVVLNERNKEQEEIKSLPFESNLTIIWIILIVLIMLFSPILITMYGYKWGTILWFTILLCMHYVHKMTMDTITPKIEVDVKKVLNEVRKKKQ